MVVGGEIGGLGGNFDGNFKLDLGNRPWKWAQYNLQRWFKIGVMKD